MDTPALTEAIRHARQLCSAELLDEHQLMIAFASELDDANQSVYLASAWPTAVRQEIERRRRLANAGVTSSLSCHQAWLDLAATIRQTADILHLVEHWTGPLRRHGREYHGPCPVCGGRDRFVVWPSSQQRGPGRYWCRQCGAAGDVIQLYRQMMAVSFYDALRQAAADLNLPLPADPITRRIETYARPTVAVEQL